MRPATETTVGPDALASYRAGALRRRRDREERRIERWERACGLARRAEKILRAEFGATRVVMFGSVLRPVAFGSRSDVDLIAWGISEERYVRAVGRLQALDSTIAIDLVHAETAPPRIVASADREGIDL